MEKLKITDATARIVELLEPFDSLERKRIVQASLTLLGDDVIQLKDISQQSLNDFDSDNTIGGQAKGWLKQNQITNDDLEHIFHIADGKAEIIVSEMPGANGKAKTINAYILQGIAGYLTSGIAKFDDKSARDLCIRSGCFSAPNHALYIKGLGNRVTGSKEVGWTLTAPGLKFGAELIKGLIKNG